jgi:hypothetical protein
MSQRTESLFEWAQWATEREREVFERVPRRIIDTRGVFFEPTQIELTGGNGTLARVVRTRDHVLGPLIRMPLPNQATDWRWQEAFTTFKREGIPVFCVPRAVLENSDIRARSIEVIHTEKRRRFARPPHQVLKATVHPRWLSSKHAREAYFLSGYDLKERGLSYFFCELPPGFVPTTVEDAYQSLQPESVKRALSQKRKVLRQGDMFFIQMRGEPEPHQDWIVTDGRLFDTNHFATERARSDGMVMVRGRIEHKPFGRRPDHRPLRLPRGWWITVRNTVPVVRN